MRYFNTKIIAQFDAASESTINFPDFVCSIVKIIMNQQCENELALAFNILAGDEKNYISHEEMKDVFRKINDHISEEQLNNWMLNIKENVDLSKDGISYEDFKDIFDIFRC